MSSVKAVTVRKFVILVYALFLKVPQNDQFWVAPSVAPVELFHYTHNSLQWNSYIL